MRRMNLLRITSAALTVAMIMSMCGCSAESSSDSDEVVTATETETELETGDESPDEASTDEESKDEESAEEIAEKDSTEEEDLEEESVEEEDTSSDSETTKETTTTVETSTTVAETTTTTAVETTTTASETTTVVETTTTASETTTTAETTTAVETTAEITEEETSAEYLCGLNTFSEEFARAIFDAQNELRAEEGLDPLIWSDNGYDTAKICAKAYGDTGTMDAVVDSTYLMRFDENDDIRAIGYKCLIRECPLANDDLTSEAVLWLEELINNDEYKLTGETDTYGAVAAYNADNMSTDTINNMIIFFVYDDDNNFE